MHNGSGPTHISQVAMVVHDLDASMKVLWETLGWGPWNVYEHVSPKLHDTHLHGKPAEYSMLGAECEVQPGLVVELVQPLEGPSIYKEWLEAHGEGVQHIACMMHSQQDSDEFKKEWTDRGVNILMGGRIGETIEFYYLDTEPMLKFILESGSGHAIDLTPVRTYPPQS